MKSETELNEYGYWEEHIDLQGLPVLIWVENDEPNFDRPIGKCANCGGIIFGGDGPTVHDDCRNDFINYLNEKWRKTLRVEND